MEDQNHKQDALDCLREASVIAGPEGNSLNSPPAQADYFLQCGLINAILHLADVLGGYGVAPTVSKPKSGGTKRKGS